MSVPSEDFTSDSGGGESKNRGAGPRGEATGKAITMAAVAHLAGISQGAVSSLLNDRDYGIRISTKMREKVFKICRDIGYVPNDLRALVRIFPELGEPCLLVSGKIPGGIANPSVARIAAALMARLPRQPASLGVIQYDETRDYGPDDLPGPLKHGTASQMLCIGAGNESLCRVARERGMSAIMFGHTSHLPGVTSIVPDYPAAARLALELFRRHGHRRVGIVSGPFGSHDPRFAEMNVAIGDAAAQLGLAIDAGDVFSGNLGFDAGVAAVNQLRSRASVPSALLCLSEAAAAGALATAQSLSLAVPAQFSILTFAEHAGPIEACLPVSAVVLSADEQAAAAVQEVDRQRREGLPSGSPKITVGVHLIERDTCGPAAK